LYGSGLVDPSFSETGEPGEGTMVVDCFSFPL
jgi:hypothetical protein